MALQMPTTTKTQIVRLTKALYDAAPGNTYLTAFEGYVAESNMATFANWLASTVSSDAATLAATVVASLKMTGSVAADATTFLTSQFAANPGRYGEVILNAMNGLANMTSDATYGATATAFNQSVGIAYGYSINTSNTTQDLATLQAADEVSAVTVSTTLTTGQDNLLGYSADDSFKAYIVNNANTLQSGDMIDGGAGTDTLFADIGNSQSFAITAETKNVETVEFRAQAIASDSTDNNTSLTNEVQIDAQRMVGVNHWTNTNSRADLLIEDVRILDTQITKDITIEMKETDPGHVDFGVYFDQLSLRNSSASTSVINLRVLDTYAVAQGLAPLKDSPYGSFTFYTSADAGATYTAVTLASTDMQNAQTYAEMITALQAAADIKFGAGVVTVAAGSTYSVPDSVTGSTVSGTEIKLSASGNIMFDTTRAGSGWLATETVPAISGLYTSFNTAASTSTDLVTSKIILDDVGRGSTGGDLVVGGLSVGDTSTSKGVQRFEIEVRDNSKLQTINSTDNTLREVAIVNGVTSSQSSAYVTTVKDAGNLTVNGTVGLETGVNVALPGTESVNGGDQHNAFGFSDVRLIDGSAMRGNLAFTAEITARSKDKYLNLVDPAPALGAADNVAFAYSGGAGADVIATTIDVGVVASTNSLTGREDFTYTANGGAGNDTITTTLTNVSAAWYADQKLNKNITINGDAGNDTIMTPGWGDVKINAGTGDDTVYDDNSGTIGAQWYINAVAAVPDTQYAATAKGFMYNGKLTVAFSGDGSATLGGGVTSPVAAALANGFETTVAIPTGANYAVTQLEINQAIKLAINSDPVLNKLLSAVDGAANTLVISSKIDGAFLATDIKISVASTDVTTLSPAEQATVLAAYKTYSQVSTSTIINAQTDNAAAVTAFNGVNGMDVNQAAGFVTTGLTSAAESDNTINLGSGNDVAVLGTGALSNDTLVWTGYDQGKDTIVNFDDSTAIATAVDKLDFTSYLIDKNSLSGSIDSQKRIATTLNNDTSVEANSVTVLATPTFTATDTFSGLTAAKLLAAIQSTNLGASNYAGITSATLDAVNTYTTVAGPANLVGGVGHGVVMVENNLNKGEYAMFELSYNGLATNLTSDFTACTAIGTVDFGASVTPAMAIFA